MSSSLRKDGGRSRSFVTDARLSVRILSGGKRLTLRLNHCRRIIAQPLEFILERPIGCEVLVQKVDGYLKIINGLMCVLTGLFKVSLESSNVASIATSDWTRSSAVPSFERHIEPESSRFRWLSQS